MSFEALSNQVSLNVQSVRHLQLNLRQDELGVKPKLASSLVKSRFRSFSNMEPAMPGVHLCDNEMMVPADLHALPSPPTGPTAPPSNVPSSPHPATTTSTPQSPSMTEGTASRKHVHALMVAARQDDTERDCWQCGVRSTIQAYRSETNYQGDDKLSPKSK